MRKLRSHWCAQRPGGHAKAVADADLAIDNSNREIRLDLPALQTIIEHQHAGVDGAAREPPGFHAIGADDHRRDTREQ